MPIHGDKGGARISGPWGALPLLKMAPLMWMGFEPTPANGSRPKRDALDHSATTSQRDAVM